jgi:hypothetical protein
VSVRLERDELAPETRDAVAARRVGKGDDASVLPT